MQFILMSVAVRVPVPKVFVNCFLHVLTTHPALRKSYFLPAEVIKSKSYKMLIGCCVPTSTQGVQQGLDLPPRISAIRCVPLHKRCGHVINHTRTERREGDLCVRQESQGLCTFREPNMHTVLPRSLATSYSYICGYRAYRDLCCSRIYTEMPAHSDSDPWYFIVALKTLYKNSLAFIPKEHQ